MTIAANSDQPWMVSSAASIKTRRDQELVGDRVEHAAERGLLGPRAGQIAVEEIADRRGDKESERNPTEPEPAVKDALPEHAADHDRHGDDAAIGQNVGNVQSCVVSGGFIYCVGGFNQSGYTSAGIFCFVVFCGGRFMDPDNELPHGRRLRRLCG